MPAAALSHGERRALELAMALGERAAPAAARRADGRDGRGRIGRDRALLAGLKGRFAIVLVEHDMDAVFALADRITVLVYGRVIATRPARRRFAPTRRCAAPISARRRDTPRPDAARSKSRLEAGYGDGRVLFGVDLAVGAGEVVTLLGRNGMGKTTTFSAIMGIVRPQAGTVRLRRRGDRRSAALPHRPARARPGAGRAADLSEPDGARKPRRDGRRHAGRAAGTSTRCSSCSRRCASGSPPRRAALGRRAADAGDRAGADDQPAPAAARRGHRGSGAAHPRPRSGACWRRLKAAGQAILVVDKNIAPLLLLADRHYVLDRGRTVWSGSSAELAAAAELQHRYLGV